MQDVVDIRKHFSAPTIDEYARLPVDASAEDLLEYWQQMAEVDHDLTSGISTIRITGFDPKTSQLLVATALKQSERLVNKLSDSLRTDALIMAEKEAAQAEKEVAAIRAETTRFREKQDVLDPAAQAGARIERAESARSGMVAQLQADLARAEAELAQLSTFMQPEALKVKNLQSKVNALRQQVAKEQATSSRQSQGQSRQVAVQLSKYTELQSRQAFAEQLYQAKLGSLEQARLESARKQRYLTVTVQPNLPDEALKPERISGVLTVLLLSFLCWGIGSLSIAAIRDHVGWV
jgi:capsular polysaccharide transport system permease protein